MKGSSPGERRGGRKAGTPNSKTLEAITILKQRNCDPLDILSQIALGNKIKCGVSVEDKVFEVDLIPSLDQRKDAAKELCQYVYPKRKAVEHSGEVDTGLTVQIVKYGK